MKKYLLLFTLLSIIAFSDNLSYALNNFNDDVAVNPTQRYYLDGGVDTFFFESSPDFLTFDRFHIHE